MTHNQHIYAATIREWIPDIEDDDLAWLCNKAANIYRNINDLCIDNFRISRAKVEMIKGFGFYASEAYRQARNNGCCGFRDELVRNPATGNEFYIGFNYGH